MSLLWNLENVRNILGEMSLPPEIVSRAAHTVDRVFLTVVRVYTVSAIGHIFEWNVTRTTGYSDYTHDYLELKLPVSNNIIPDNSSMFVLSRLPGGGWSPYLE